MSGLEQTYVQDAFATNWIAPFGPHVDAFEDEFAAAVGAPYACAISSATAGLHLSLILAGVERNDEVIVSDLTFAASVNPIVYLGGHPVFVDSDRATWNMDPDLLAEVLRQRARTGKLPKAVVLVHLYGQSADIDPILELCNNYGIPLIEDAAEALGATYKGRMPGTLGRVGVYSFNGNKIITTSGGGMLVAADAALIAHARKLATQARDPAPYYQHSEIGYNYRLSNLLAAVGRGQLRVLEERVQARRRNFEFYKSKLDGIPGLEFMPEAAFGEATRWLTVITIDPKESGMDRESLRLALESKNIESRPYGNLCTCNQSLPGASMPAGRSASGFSPMGSAFLQVRTSPARICSGSSTQSSRPCSNKGDNGRVADESTARSSMHRSMTSTVCPYQNRNAIVIHILHVVGARPNFVKVAPVLAALERYPDVRQSLVHTGQHYDVNMSDIFFQQLGLPAPDVNLEVGSGSHAQQTAQFSADSNRSSLSKSRTSCWSTAM